MKLYLIRHAIAVDGGLPGTAEDGERPLSNKGRKKMRLIAKNLSAIGVEFDLILSSPFVRARDTAKILSDAFGAKNKVHLSDNLVPGGDVHQLIREINEKYPGPSLALVGHEPLLTTLIGVLIGAQGGVNVTMKKGGVCLLTAPDLAHHNHATLEWLLPPSILMNFSKG